MKVGSLFTGIGGIDLGLERVGMEIVWQVEIDPFCRKVLEKHWPNVPKYGDIRELRGDELEPVDLICGGPPCQPASCAGKRRGTADDRWLWPEALRIVAEIKPRWCLFENPTGILSLQGGVPFESVLSQLEAEGYETGAFIIPACAVGAPHRRDRVWIVAHTRGGGFGESGICKEQQRRTKVVGASKDVAHAKGGQDRRLQQGGLQPDIRTEGQDVAHAQDTKRQRAGDARKRRDGFTDGGQDVADADGAGCEKCDIPTVAEGQGYCSRSAYSQWREWPAQSGLGGMLDGLPGWLDRYRWPAPYGCEQYEWEPPRVTSGVPNRVNRLKALGNAVVPKIPEIIGLAIMQIEEGMKV